MPDVHHGPEHLVRGGGLVEKGAWCPARGDDTGEVLPDVDLAIGVPEVGHDLRVGGVHVERFAEGFLCDLPVGVDDLGHVAWVYRLARFQTVNCATIPPR